MIHKLLAYIEPIFVIIAISLQPLIGLISGTIAAVYYLSMLKINVVDKKYNGSWKAFIKSIL